MKYFTKVGETEREFVFARHGNRIDATSDGRSFAIDLASVGDGTFSILVDGRCYDCVIDRQEGRSIVLVKGERIVVDVEDERERAAHAVASAKGGGKQILEAAMPGVVVDLRVAVGDVVEEGQVLVILEAMKMQNPLAAEGPGVVSKVLCQKGQAVAGGSVLVEIDPPESESPEVGAAQ